MEEVDFDAFFSPRDLYSTLALKTGIGIPEVQKHVTFKEITSNGFLKLNSGQELRSYFGSMYDSIVMSDEKPYFLFGVQYSPQIKTVLNERSHPDIDFLSDYHSSERMFY